MLRLQTGLPVLVALAALAASPGFADAKKKKGGAPPCGHDFLPLVAGAEWTYEHFVPPGVQRKPGALYVDPPDTVKVKVVKVEESDGKTRITVEESWRKVTVQNELTCTKDSLQVPPTSFFFAGAPGGGVGIKLEKLEVRGESFLPKRGVGEDTYQEFKAVAVRTPAEGSGAVIPPARLEIERKMTVGGRQEVESAMGMHRATRVDVVVTARAALETAKDKPYNMPEAGAAMWFENGVGVVRVETRLGEGWRLVEHKVAGAEE